MSTERDELRADLLDEHGYCVNCGEDAEDCECGFGEFIDSAVAAGWRKPRVVTTAEELEALPEGTVALDADGDVARKFRDGWRVMVVEPYDSAWLTDATEDIAPPAKILGGAE